MGYGQAYALAPPPENNNEQCKSPKTYDIQHSDVIYFIIASSIGDEHYIIDQATGVITLVRELDFENATQTHILIVQATDGGGETVSRRLGMFI